MFRIFFLTLSLLCAGSEIKTDWAESDAAHLLRRAGFSGTPTQIQHLASIGKKAAVNELLHYEKTPFDFPTPNVFRQEPELFESLRGMEKEQRENVAKFDRLNNQIQFQNLSDWWLRRMIATPRPLEEKLVLFWHGHFTSGMREVKDAQMLYRQNELFRKHASGNFRVLLSEILRDPAMLRYLDADQNLKDKPNENLARELLELFTMGVGNYTEQDIQETARALTGWSVERKSGESKLRPRQHDEATKKVLGEKGNFDSEDLVEIILKKPACAEFIAGKLWKFFAAKEASVPWRRELATLFRKNDYELKPLLLVIFNSDEFYDESLRFENIKSPVEFVVGTFRLLEIQPQNAPHFVAALSQMGQELFQPPNVKGWDGGLTWIDASSLFARYQFGKDLLYGIELNRGREKISAKMENLPEELEMAKRDSSESQAPFNPQPILSEYSLENAERLTVHFLDRLIQHPLSSEQRAMLIEHFKKIAEEVNSDSSKTATAVRGLIHLILSMPEYQLS